MSIGWIGVSLSIHWKKRLMDAVPNVLDCGRYCEIRSETVREVKDVLGTSESCTEETHVATRRARNG